MELLSVPARLFRVFECGRGFKKRVFTRETEAAKFRRQRVGRASPHSIQGANLTRWSSQSWRYLGKV